jgi:hypothetical protein
VLAARKSAPAVDSCGVCTHGTRLNVKTTMLHVNKGTYVFTMSGKPWHCMQCHTWSGWAPTCPDTAARCRASHDNRLGRKRAMNISLHMQEHADACTWQFGLLVVARPRSRPQAGQDVQVVLINAFAGVGASGTLCVLAPSSSRTTASISTIRVVRTFLAVACRRRPVHTGARIPGRATVSHCLKACAMYQYNSTTHLNDVLCNST